MRSFALLALLVTCAFAPVAGADSVPGPPGSGTSFSGDIESADTSGAVGTAPVSDGAGNLNMTDIALQSELDVVADLWRPLAIGSLPTCDGALAATAAAARMVNDGLTVTDCSTGGGSERGVCLCDGSSWVSPSVDGLTLDQATGPITFDGGGAGTVANGAITNSNVADQTLATDKLRLLPADSEAVGDLVSIGTSENFASVTGVQGDVLYHNGTRYTKLSPGTSGHFLQTQGAAANPQWASGAAGATTAGAEGIHATADTATKDFLVGGTTEVGASIHMDASTGDIATDGDFVSRVKQSVGGKLTLLESLDEGGQSWTLKIPDTTDFGASDIEWTIDENGTLDPGVIGSVTEYVFTEAELESCLESAEVVNGTSAKRCEIGGDHELTITSPLVANLPAGTGRTKMILACNGGLLRYTSSGDDEVALEFNFDLIGNSGYEMRVEDCALEDDGSGDGTIGIQAAQTVNRSPRLVLDGVEIRDFETSIKNDLGASANGVTLTVRDSTVTNPADSFLNWTRAGANDTTTQLALITNVFEGASPRAANCATVEGGGADFLALDIGNHWSSCNGGFDFERLSWVTESVFRNIGTGTDPWFSLGGTGVASGAEFQGRLFLKEGSSIGRRLIEIDTSSTVDIDIVPSGDYCDTGFTGAGGVLIDAVDAGSEIGQVRVRWAGTSDPGDIDADCAFNARYVSPRAYDVLDADSEIRIEHGDVTYRAFPGFSGVTPRVPPECFRFTDITGSTDDEALPIDSNVGYGVREVSCFTEGTSASITLKDDSGNAMAPAAVSCGTRDATDDVLASECVENIDCEFTIGSGSILPGSVVITGTGVEIHDDGVGGWLGDVELDFTVTATNETQAATSGCKECAGTLLHEPLDLDGTTLATDGTQNATWNNITKEWEGNLEADPLHSTETVDDSASHAGDGTCDSGLSCLVEVANGPVSTSTGTWTCDKASSSITVTGTNTCTGDLSGGCVANYDTGALILTWVEQGPSMATADAVMTCTYNEALANDLTQAGVWAIPWDDVTASNTNITYDYVAEQGIDYATGVAELQLATDPSEDLDIEFVTGATPVPVTAGGWISPFEGIEFDTDAAVGSGLTKICLGVSEGGS